MYKPLLPFIFAAFCIPSLQAQTLKTGALGKAGETSGWIEFHSSLNLNPKTVLADHKAEFGLAAEDELRLSRAETDELGMSHYRFQMYREGVKVETGQYIVHARAGRAEIGNGYLPQLPQLSTVPAMGADAARQLALSHMNAQTYMWEQPGSEAALKHSRKDPAATFYPQPELVLTDTDFDRDNGSGWVLAWKADVYAAQPVSRKWIYIDAATGKVVKELETLHLHHPDQVQANATGSAVTRYSGTQTIVTDQTATGFRLREAARGLGVDIETYDLNQSTDFGQAVDFVDDDNVWNNINTEFDEAATDAHWGAEMTHDYFLQKFGRSSFDGKGSIMKSYVHYDVAYFNAFWNGIWMTFGDGNGAPLTSLDVVGHEFAHGVTGNSAELIYAYEPGALNESFSDIFGNSIEHFADTTIADWRIGEGFGAFRNMASPSFFGDPDTYKGSNWVYGTFDNGGVHINSGVQNKWYYLLVEGGSGTNNKGQAYQVTGIGWNAAAAIAYRNLTTYLSSASQFADAREGAVQSAIDLYGLCSPEYQAVVNAWHAVGIGQPVREDDFGVVEILPIEPCGLGSQEQVSVKIRYYGCQPKPAGQILVAFSRVPFDVAVELMSYPALVGGDEFIYTFNKKTNLSAPGLYSFVSQTASATDPYTLNDSSEYYVTYNSPGYEEGTIDFEPWGIGAQYSDSIYLRKGAEADIRIVNDEGNNESRGLRMEGGFRERFSFFYYGVDAFQVNKEYAAEACICIKGEQMQTLGLTFDRRQTFSPYREINLGLDSSFTATRISVLRVTANGDEVARYYPQSHNSDPYTQESLNLGAYVGGTVRLCFEGKMNQSRDVDGFDIGDRIYIDNINLDATFNTNAVSPDPEGYSLNVFPNPSSGDVQVTLRATRSSHARLRLINSLGQEVLAQEWAHASGENHLNLPVADLAPGVYQVCLTTEKGLLIRNWVKQ